MRYAPRVRAAASSAARAHGMGILKRMVASGMALASPHMRELGIRFVSVEPGVAIAMVPWRAELVGDPTAGVFHGGVVTTLLDSTAGAAVFSAVDGFLPIATLDLRIDYVRPSTPHLALYARVECYKLTRHIAFTRGTAYNHDERDAVATMAATFMLNTQAQPRGKADRGDG